METTNNVILSSDKKASKARKDYARNTELKVRSFASYMREIQRDLDALDMLANETAKRAEAESLKNEAKSLKGDEAKTKRAEAERILDALNSAIVYAHTEKGREALSDLKRTLDGAKLEAREVTPKFIRDFAPELVNADGLICDVHKIALEDEADALKNPLLDVHYINGVAVYLTPVTLWTASKVLAKFAKAAKNRADALRAENQLQREAEREAREARQIEALKARLEAYEAKQRAKAEAKTKAEA